MKSTLMVTAEISAPSLAEYQEGLRKIHGHIRAIEAELRELDSKWPKIVLAEAKEETD